MDKKTESNCWELEWGLTVMELGAIRGDKTVLYLGFSAGYMILCFRQNMQNYTLKRINCTVYTLYLIKKKYKISLIIKSKKKKKKEPKCVSS